MIAVMKVSDIKRQVEPWSSNQRIAFDFGVDRVLPMLTANGVWSGTEPSPLNWGEIVDVFVAIYEHSVYQDQTITLFDHDNTPVTLRANGVIQIGNTVGGIES